jgi:AcrR family transcriptional regulator
MTAILTQTPPPRPSPRAASHQRRDAILAVAHQVFLEHGYEAASMSQIAARVGGSKGTLYSYFDNKAALFAALVAESCARNSAAIFDIPKDARGDTALLAIARAYIALVTSDWATRMFQIIAAEAQRWPELAMIFFESGPAAAAAQLSRHLAENGAADGLVIPDSDAAAQIFLTLCRGSLHMRRILGLAPEPDAATLDEQAARAVTAFRKLHAGPAV